MPKIEIVAKPATPSAQNQAKAAQSSRDRAMAMLMSSSGQAQQAPVANPSQISPEETTNLNSSAPVEGQPDTMEGSAPEANATGEAPPQEANQPEEEKPLSSQYAVLARKEKALRAREQSFKTREAQLTAREAELSNPSQPSFDKSKYISIDDLKRNAYGKLQEIGLSYDDISAQALQSQSPEFQAMQQMRTEIDAKLEKLESEQAKVSKTFEDQQTQSYKAALNQIEAEAKQLISSSEEFETIKEMGAHKDVVDLIEKTFQEDGTLLTVQQAASQVEEYLIEEALKLANLKKIQARLKPAAPAASATKQPVTSAAPQSKTLTNSMGSTRQLSARERALLAFKGEPKA